MTVKAVLVDDSQTDLKYAHRLTRSGLSCEALLPPPTSEELRDQIAARVANRTCDIILLDYRLDAETGEASVARSYRGGTAAAELREHLPDLPIVLVSTEQKLQDGLAGKSEVRSLFDHTILKQRLASRGERPAVVTELRSLAHGFRRIAGTPGSGWKRIGSLLDREEAADAIAKLDVVEAPAGTAEIRAWIVDGLLAFPGLLLDEHDASASLGIGVATFRRTEVQDALTSHRYGGVFSEMATRWWAADLSRWLTQMSGDTPGIAGEDRARRIAAGLELPRQAVRAATCTWCAGKDVVRACALCREHVDPLHGLQAHVGERPRWVSPAYVCFTCIENGQADGVRFQAGTESIVRGVKTGKTQRWA